MTDTINSQDENQDRAIETHGLVFSAVLRNTGMISIGFNVDDKGSLVYQDTFSIFPSDSLEEMLSEVMIICERATVENEQDFSLVIRNNEGGFYAMITPSDSPVKLDAAAAGFNQTMQRAHEASQPKQSKEQSAGVSSKVVDINEPALSASIGFESHALFIAAIANDEMHFFPLMLKDDVFLFGETSASYPKASAEIQTAIIQKTIEETVKLNNSSYALLEKRLDNETRYALIAPIESLSLFPIEQVCEAFYIFLEKLVSDDKSDSSEYLQ